MTEASSATAPEPSFTDLLSEIDVVDPYPVWQALLDGPPVVDPGGAFAILTRAEDCAAVLKSGSVSSDQRNSAVWQARVLPHLGPADLERLERNEVFLFRDPPSHTRLRRLVSKAFTARTVERLQPLVERLTDELLDAAADRGRLEVVADIAYPLPVAVISAMLGVPREDHATFAGWSQVLARGLDDLFSEPDPVAARARQRASEDFRAYFAALADARRRAPQDDLLSALVAAEDEGDRLTSDELVSTAMLLLIAGHETTVSLLGNGMLALLRVPGLHARLQRDPALAAGVVEEVLRLDPPVQITVRTALEPLPVPGGVLRPGGTAVLLLAAAGRDGDAVPDPLRFDPERGSAGSHLAFGAGIHYCLGAPLARLEGRVVLAELARRLQGPRLEDLAYRENRVLRGPSRLVVGYDALLRSRHGASVPA